MTELDHVGTSEVTQIHPHRRLRNAQHPRKKISNSDQDLILGGVGPLGANVAIDEYAVGGCGLQPDEVVAGLEVTKDALANSNRSAGVAAVDPRNPVRDLRLLLGRRAAFVGITDIRGHAPSRWCGVWVISESVRGG